ncbi:MAG: hypothetical protein IANPNBLG_04675 [Bryobacteraceae bacterium]|nr:hypothetical protein [Bryobacteraceae bacterium]
MAVREYRVPCHQSVKSLRNTHPVPGVECDHVAGAGRTAADNVISGTACHAIAAGSFEEDAVTVWNRRNIAAESVAQRGQSVDFRPDEIALNGVGLRIAIADPYAALPVT